MRHIKRLKIILVGAAWLAGSCSPAVYKEGIGDFSKSVEKASLTFNTLRAQEEEATAEIDGPVIRRGPTSNLVVNTDCELGKPEICGLFYKGAAFPQEKSGPNTAKLMKLLSSYAKGLATIANSKDADAVNEAANKVSAALGSLAKAVSKNSDKLSANVDFVEGAFKWLFGVYVDQKRVNTLAQAITTADPLIKSTGTVLAAQLPTFVKIIMNNKKARLDHGLELLDGNLAQLKKGGKNAPASADILKLIQALASESRSLRALAATTPVIAVDKMVEAHAALEKALTDGATDFDVVFARISEFADQIEKLGKALKSP